MNKFFLVTILFCCSATALALWSPVSPDDPAHRQIQVETETGLSSATEGQTEGFVSFGAGLQFEAVCDAYGQDEHGRTHIRVDAATADHVNALSRIGVLEPRVVFPHRAGSEDRLHISAANRSALLAQAVPTTEPNSLPTALEQKLILRIDPEGHLHFGTYEEHFLPPGALDPLENRGLTPTTGIASRGREGTRKSRYWAVPPLPLDAELPVIAEMGRLSAEYRGGVVDVEEITGSLARVKFRSSADVLGDAAHPLVGMIGQDGTLLIWARD